MKIAISNSRPIRTMPGLFNDPTPDELMAKAEAEQATNALAAQTKALIEQDKRKRDA